MTRTLEIPAGFDVLVETRPSTFAWTARAADGRALSGPAPDAESARRRAAFAAGALHALQRISRRGF